MGRTSGDIFKLSCPDLTYSYTVLGRLRDSLLVDPSLVLHLTQP